MTLLQPAAFQGEPTLSTPANLDRLAILGAMFRPSDPAVAGHPLGSVGGALYGPPNTQGELSLVSDVQLRVKPARWVIPSSLSGHQGTYEVVNPDDALITVPAKDASQFRRGYVGVYVRDAFAAGTGTQNDAVLEVLPGALAATNPQLPTVLPSNLLILGEVSIPSTASGQPVTLTPYNPRTGLRGGINPTIIDGSTVPGHDGAPGQYDGQYRDQYGGLARWNATASQHRPVTPQYMTAAQRIALTDAGLLANGTIVYETDTDRVVIRRGGVWRLLTPELYSTTGGNSLNWAGTTFGWVPNHGAKQLIPADNIQRNWAAWVHGSLSGGEFWVRLRWENTTSNTSVYFPSATGWRFIPNTESPAMFQANGSIPGSGAYSVYIETRATVSGQPSFLQPTVNILCD